MKTHSINPKFFAIIFALVVLFGTFDFAVADSRDDGLFDRSPDALFDSAEDELFEELDGMDIGELINLKITSVSRKEERLSEAAAAIFVLTEEDILRSGANSIPDLLRLVPGLHVAQTNSSAWAISARGFNGLFATKLLVLIDGRSVYTPVFSGVFWDSQDVILEDIERIEVIRGPGATVYGANAVNGVINVITKNASKTQGGLVSLKAGNEEKVHVATRFGGKIGENTSYRVYGKYFDRDASVFENGDESSDEWEQLQTGFRFDIENDNKSLVVLGDAYFGEFGTDFNLVDSTAEGFSRAFEAERETNGQNFLVRYSDRPKEGSELQLQMYYDRVDRDDDVVATEVETIDFDMQYRFEPFARNDLTWGFRYRIYQDELESGELVRYDDVSRTIDLVSAFVQNEYRPSESLKLVLGSKFEHNDFTGFEYQPSVKMVWTPNTSQSIWGAVSRAIRSPSRSNEDVFLPVSVVPIPGVGPAVASVVGSKDVEAEDVTAFELGYRQSFGEALSLDLAIFRNELRDGVSFTPRTPGFDSSFGQVVVPLVTTNFLEGDATGGELLLNYQAAPWWRIALSYSLVVLDLELEEAGQGDMISLEEEGQIAENQVLLRSLMDIGDNYDLNFALRYVDEVEAIEIDEYVELDLGVSWKASENLTLSIEGRNLLESSHAEYSSDFISQPIVEIERQVYGQLRYRF